ncbi:MAG: HEAT repeat domain-containing protein [Verrucomicrobia bacterium]|nr:HEAT repeat domain-containing protein [Verrucomicrobiota bacterium]MBI3870972.1 HEAT repeat domain-containing protein [Verrucomicrobiota bacterium]
MKARPPSSTHAAWLALAFVSLSCLTVESQIANPPTVEDPEHELETLRVLDGYEANLFASEANGVVKPMQIRFDTRGRLWVAGSTVYPQIEPGQIPNDKIVVLEDLDGDGRADRTTVFAEGLMIPTGMELGDGGVYVGQGTELLHLKDTDGDGRADERRVVLRGFGTGDSHQTINSFTWSPGGQLFFCQGLHAFSRVETPWGIEKLHQAGVWRFHPRRLRLDPFLDEAMGPQNPYGVVFDRWGQPIVVAGNGEGVYFLTPGMTRSHERYPMRSLWNTGRKFGGGDFVENAHWRPEHQGELITGSYINNTVSRFRITDEGSGFRVEDLPPLITSANRAFRIVDARFGPDGALYLCDWYNPIIGHYQASFRHPGRDKTHGRVWRVTAKGRPLTARPRLDSASPEELLRLLGSPDRWTRQMAKRRLTALLDAMPEEAGTALLSRRARNLDPRRDGEAHELMELLGVYESLERVDRPLLERALVSPAPEARAYAVGVLGRWADRVASPLDLLSRAVLDDHPRVRLEAVIAASYVAAPEALPVALRSMDRPSDEFIHYALGQAIRVLKPLWAPALRSGQLSLRDSVRGVEFLARADRSGETLGFIQSQLKDPGLAPESREGLLAVLAQVGDGDDLAPLLDPDVFDPGTKQGLGVLARALASVMSTTAPRSIHATPAFVARFESVLEKQDPAIVPALLRLAGFWELGAMRGRVQAAARNSQATTPVRVGAIQALGRLASTNDLPWIRSLALEDDSLWPAAIEALSALRLSDAVEATVAWMARRHSSAETASVVGSVLGKKRGPELLGAALRGKPINGEVAAAALNVMGASGRSTPALARLLAASAGWEMDLSRSDPRQWTALAQRAQALGNGARGAVLFQRADLNCVSCHSILGKGGTLGPDLGALGSSQPMDFIVGAVLDPQREVKEGFMATQITLKDGEERQGYVAQETSEEITLRDALLQKEIRLRKAQIQERRQLGSLMPSGLTDRLSTQEFLDLMKYLSGLGVAKF